MSIKLILLSIKTSYCAFDLIKLNVLVVSKIYLIPAMDSSNQEKDPNETVDWNIISLKFIISFSIEKGLFFF